MLQIVVMLLVWGGVGLVVGAFIALAYDAWVSRGRRFLK